MSKIKYTSREMIPSISTQSPLVRISHTTPIVVSWGYSKIPYSELTNRKVLLIFLNKLESVGNIHQNKKLRIGR